MTTHNKQPRETRFTGLERAIAQFVSSCNTAVNAYQVTQALQATFPSLDQQRVNLALARLAGLNVLAKPIRGYYQAGPALAEYLTSERKRRGGRKPQPGSRLHRVKEVLQQLFAEHELVTYYQIREAVSKALECDLQDKMPEAAIVLRKLIEEGRIRQVAKGVYQRLQ